MMDSVMMIKVFSCCHKTHNINSIYLFKIIDMFIRQQPVDIAWGVLVVFALNNMEV